MKLTIKAKLGTETQDILLPVGPGTQTFKWLANAAAYRLVSDGARRGRFTRRGRDRITLPAKTQLLPKDVYSDDCPFFHPDGVLKDHLEDGHTVNVDLYDTLEVDAYGIPVLSPWATIAFRHDERHEEERLRLEEEKKLEVSTFREEKATQALIAKTNLEKPKLALMTKIMAPQLVSDSTIAATLSQEWGLIKASGTLDNIVPDKEQQEAIRGFFVQYFVEINDLYKFYSAVNSGGGTHTLEYIELTKFLTETGILGEEHSNAILRIFVDSHITSSKSRGARPSIHSEIRRHEFFVCLIRIAIYKNNVLPKKELAKLRKKGHEVSRARAALPAAPQALEMMYHDFLAPVLEKMPAGKDMREAVASNSTLILLYDNLAQLAQCFEKYAEIDGDEAEEGATEDPELSMIPGGSMNIQSFAEFAEDARFVDDDRHTRRFSDHRRKHSIMGSRSNLSITQKDVRQIFSASQHDSEVPNEIEQSRVAEDDNLSSHHELMIFSEFLEAVARLGVLKHGHQKHSFEEEGAGLEQEEILPHYECIKLAVEQVCALVS